MEERSDVDAVAVDRHGELLRVTHRADRDVAAILDALERMGFAAEEASPADVAAARWYGSSEVGELSREEAAVIAARVVPAFAAANALDPEQVDAASRLVADALYACFIGRKHVLASPASLAASCGGAVELATRLQLGADRAAMLGRAIEADLAGASAA